MIPLPSVARTATRGVAGCTLVAAACASSGGPSTDYSPTAPPGVVLDNRVDTYAVHGRTIAEVRRSMADEAPDATRTPGYRGVHEYSIGWNWGLASGGTAIGCELHDVRVTVTSRIIVPAWVPDSAAEPGLAEQWQALDALRFSQRQYDESTAHGRTQGAVWPPLARRASR